MKSKSVLVIAIVVQMLSSGLSQEKAVSVSFSQLIDHSSAFDGKVVEVRGYLKVHTQPRHAPVIVLYQGREDAADLLTKNQLLVIPSREMFESRADLDRNDVRLVGKVRAVRSAYGSYAPVLREVQHFSLATEP